MLLEEHNTLFGFQGAAKGGQEGTELERYVALYEVKLPAQLAYLEALLPAGGGYFTQKESALIGDLAIFSALLCLEYTSKDRLAKALSGFPKMSVFFAQLKSDKRIAQYIASMEGAPSYFACPAE